MVICNAPTKMMKDLWYGDGYKYAHDQEDWHQPDGTIKTDNQHFPEQLKWRKYF
jgi:replication-associated recombination protein RarA